MALPPREHIISGLKILKNPVNNWSQLKEITQGGGPRSLAACRVSGTWR